MLKVLCDVHRKIVVRCLGWALASDEATPRLVALVDDLSGIFLVLRLAGERKLVFGLAIGDFVDTVLGFFLSLVWSNQVTAAAPTGTTHSWHV